jgi:hypothetical protein
MSACERLFRANKVSAYYVTNEKRVVIVAEVTVNPVADHVHICPNPIAMPPSREFLVAGTTSDGIHPDLVVNRRVSYSYSSDLTPKSVIVYSQGIDSPARQEVAVGSVASASAVPLSDPHDQDPQPVANAPQQPVEVIGFSPRFSLEEAVQDALAQAAAKIPAPPRNPDVAVSIDIEDISARSGGNIRPGLLVRAIAR